MTTTGPVTFRDVLGVREFRAVWIALAQSSIGDQFARVALSVLVFARTDSPSLSALVYALTFLPALVGGVALGGLADILSRRRVLIGCDVLRAGLIAVMAVPSLPLWALFVLLVAAVLLGPLFSAAVGALLPDIFASENEYLAGSALRTISDQVAQVIGFAVGGTVVATVGSRGALLVDAATFAVSAVAVAVFVRERSPARRPAIHPLRALSGAVLSVRGSGRVVLRDPVRRALLGLGALAGFLVVPEGLAVPYAAQQGAGAVAVGLLLAALPAGTAVGAALVGRWLPAQRRIPATGVMATLGGLPLAACAVRPSIAVTTALFALAGICCGYQILASATFVRSTPPEVRASAIGIASSVLLASQGIGTIGFGLVADHLGAAVALALAGGAAAGAGVLLTAALHKAIGGSGPETVEA